MLCHNGGLGSLNYSEEWLAGDIAINLYKQDNKNGVRVGYVPGKGIHNKNAVKLPYFEILEVENAP